ncbi:ANTAR domain-containing protein [Streptomyces sp. NPDC029674]|uniref:ANTAR domain-containing protein n=1 Tax=Streptomyces sp. NPDC029674 TaxID=3365297 RepID=UPI003850F826
MNTPEEAERPADTVARLKEGVEQLRHAVESHATVDQAIGIVVALGRLTPDEAWDVLREVSQQTNVKLRHVADLVVTWGRTGHLPADIRTVLDTCLARRSTAPPAADPAV